MTRKIALLLSLPLLLSTNALARNPVWMQLSGGGTWAQGVDGARSIDGPGIDLGLGFGAYAAKPLDLYLTFSYGYFPSTDDEPALTTPSVSANAAPGPALTSSVGKPFHSFDTSFGIRLMPKGDERTHRPYILVGMGMSWLSRGGLPGTENTIGDTVNNPYVAVGVGFEGVLSGDNYFTFEFITKKLVDRDGAYYPITAGIRF